MHVRGQSHAPLPIGFEVQAEAQRSVRPLVLEVLGRHHHDHGAAFGAQILAQRGEGEGRLAGARARDSEEVGRPAGAERFECIALPGS